MRSSSSRVVLVNNSSYSNRRYFDFRVALNEAEQKIYFVHGVFCEEITEPLINLLNFLQEHPREFVILDFQHFYAFEELHHQKLIAILLKLFKDKLCEPDDDGPDSNLNRITLSNSCSNGKQLVIIYRNGTIDSKEFFRSWNFPTPWPETTKIIELKDFLDRRLGQRQPTQGFVSQLLLTPDAKYIIPRFYSTLRKTCAYKVDSQMLDWLREQTPGVFKTGEKPTVNVIVADFVDIQDDNFCKIVVDLNMKLKAD